MGGIHTKEKCITSSEKVAMESLKNKVKILQEEIHEIMCIRDLENQGYEHESMVFALKEVEWKKEKKKLKEEVKKLKKKSEGCKLEENLEENLGFYENFYKEVGFYGHLKMLEELKEEQNRRDGAVEKWKQLYFAIKIELDVLIQRTYQDGMLCKTKEEALMVEQLQKELISKEESIRVLKEEMADIKKQEYKLERELDILRQSLRIMCFYGKRQQRQTIKIVTKHTRSLYF